MKSKIFNSLPPQLADAILTWRTGREVRRQFAQDRKRYLRYVTPNDRIARTGPTEADLRTQATKDYHRVEKGLALRAPARPFGAAVGARLDTLLPLIPTGLPLYEHVSSARAALSNWNIAGERADDVSPIVEEKAPVMDRDALHAFFTTRRSVRDFDDRDVPVEELMQAAELAGTSPSVCNRQGWRVYFTDSDDARRRLLKFQNGNRGFGLDAPRIAMVTVDTRLFSGAGERNQPWIDGALFSMSFVMACHGLGLSTCMLNMSTSNERFDALREEFSIPDYEVVIMMIAIGYARPGHRVARSPRRASAEIVSLL